MKELFYTDKYIIYIIICIHKYFTIYVEESTGE